MADARPFKGIRYDETRFPLEDVSAPPYDVIDASEQNALYEKHPYNVIRLILGKTNENDSETDNRYTRARETFERWKREEALREDDAPYYYALRQDYRNKYGEKKSTLGVIAEVKLRAFSEGVILPHERTLSKPKADRLNLTKATRANLSQVYLLYEDKNRAMHTTLETAIAGAQPLFSFVDASNVTNTLWRVRAEEGSAIAEYLSDKKLYIADGHHRYDTMIAYRDYRSALEPNAPDDAPFTYVMAYLTGVSEDDLTVYPTHRLIFNAEEERLLKLPQALKEHFTVEEVSVRETPLDAMLAMLRARRETPTFAFYRNNAERYTLFSLKHPDSLERLIPDERACVRALDVTVLHRLVIEPLLGISKEAQAAQTNLKYTRDDDYAKRAVESGEFQASFFMNATPLARVLDVANEGAVMPQKSTYFFPKLPSGLVMRAM